MEFYDKPSIEDLEHYGVKGMKWGVRKNPERAYEKATKKLTKLDAKAVKSEQKTLKAQRKSLNRQQRANSALLFKERKAKRAASSIRKSNKQHLKTQRKYEKAKRWYNSMDSVFKNTRLSNLDPSKTDLGRKYANMKLDDMMSNATTAASMIQLMDYYERKAKK